MLFDVVDSVLHRTDFLGVFVGDIDLEGFFEGEHELDQTERVGAEIVDERRLRLDVFLVDIEKCATLSLRPEEARKRGRASKSREGG